MRTRVTTQSMKVYIAGPMTSSGRLTDNVSDAVKAGSRLLNEGVAVYWPQLGVLADMIERRPESEWLDLDKVWLLQCDAVLRLPGYSKGADMEEEWATNANIPVFRTVEAVLEWAKNVVTLPY